MTRSNRESNPRRAWELAKAKERFDEVVRLASSGRPQRIVARGREAVVVVDAAEFDELRARAKGTDLHELLSASPLRDLDFERESVRGPVRNAWEP